MNVRTILAPNQGPFTLDGTRTYIVGEVAMIDPGPPISSHVEALSAETQVETIFVTHRHGDHAPAAAILKERLGARLVAPAATLEDVADETLRDGAQYGAITAIATPGHTAEHFCFLTDDGDLFTGDTILGVGTTAIFPPDGHMGQYLDSLRKLRDLQPRRIYPGHGPVREDAVEWIDYYIQHRLEREQQIVACLADGALSTTELVKKIYPDLHTGLQPAAEAQLTAHGIHLVEQGTIREIAGRWQRT